MVYIDALSTYVDSTKKTNKISSILNIFQYFSQTFKKNVEVVVFGKYNILYLKSTH